MIRDKPYYSKKRIRALICQGKIQVTQGARKSAKDDFWWSVDDICKAMLALKTTQCYKSEPRYQNPKIHVDYYRAHNIKGENVYTHFYIDDNTLIIDSFKELNHDEML